MNARDKKGFKKWAAEEMKEPEHKRKSGGGIHIKKENVGKLHKSMGIPEDKKIPVSKLEKEKNSRSAITRKRATFALNMNH